MRPIVILNTSHGRETYHGAINLEESLLPLIRQLMGWHTGTYVLRVHKEDVELVKKSLGQLKNPANVSIRAV